MLESVILRRLKKLVTWFCTVRYDQKMSDARVSGLTSWWKGEEVLEQASPDKVACS